MKPIRLSDISPTYPYRAVVMAQLEKQTPRRPPRIKGEPRKGWEADYARHLYFLMLAGEIDCYLYEPWSFPLGNRRKYTPDFLVWYPDGRCEAHEAKGYLWPRDAVRLDWFREQYPALPLRIVRRKGGAWVLSDR